MNRAIQHTSTARQQRSSFTPSRYTSITHDDHNARRHDVLPVRWCVVFNTSTMFLSAHFLCSWVLFFENDLLWVCDRHMHKILVLTSSVTRSMQQITTLPTVQVKSTQVVFINIRVQIK